MWALNFVSAWMLRTDQLATASHDVDDFRVNYDPVSNLFYSWEIT